MARDLLAAPLGCSGVTAERRLSFGTAAEEYERARQGFPEALVDDVLLYAGLPAGALVLEIGAGTGKATRSFAARGVDVVCLEPDPAMAAVLRRVCPQADIEVVSFEDYPLPGERFGLVLCAQAWHWLDAGTRVERTAQTLVPGGAVAVFWNDYELPPALRGRVNAVWQARAPELAGGYEAIGRALAEAATELRAAGFVDVECRRYPVAELDLDACVELLGTTSACLVLPPVVRGDLLAETRRVLATAGPGLSVPGSARLVLGRKPGPTA
jgi:SAM-dependent methyltransferase